MSSPAPKPTATAGPAERGCGFGGNAIDELARRAAARGALDLARGAPELAPPDELLAAAAAAIRRDFQYTDSWGIPALRRAIADHVARQCGIEVDPETEVTVTCGATEGVLDAVLAAGERGSEAVVFEPCYETYLHGVALAGMEVRTVALEPPDWRLDERALDAAFGPRTRLVVLNSPGNPTGKVWTADELAAVAARCRRHGALCVSDEVYEHLVYDGRRHRSPLAAAGMRDRTLLVGSLSKSFNATGWRIGWVVAAPALTAAVRKVHEVTTCCAAAPLQAAAVAAFELPPSYHRELRTRLERHRDLLTSALAGAGFGFTPPQGGYFVLAELAEQPFADSLALCEYMLDELGLAAVPGRAFFVRQEDGARLVRFCFCKSESTLREAGVRLANLGTARDGRRS